MKATQRHLPMLPEGIDRERVETLIGRAGKPNKVPLITGPLKVAQTGAC